MNSVVALVENLFIAKSAYNDIEGRVGEMPKNAALYMEKSRLTKNYPR